MFIIEVYPKNVFVVISSANREFEDSASGFLQRMNDYQPVDCALHSEFELLAMRRAGVSLLYTDAQGARSRLSGQVEDVFTRKGAEYLCLRLADGEMRNLRLDRIRLL